MASFESQSLLTEGRKTVLLVEDDNGVRGLLSEILAAEGYEVLEARDGQEALRLSSEEPSAIHLMITDIVMPRMNGAEVSQRLMRSRPNMRILFMTGYPADYLAKQAMPKDILVIQKPFSVTTMVQKVRSVLDASMTPANQIA